MNVTYRIRLFTEFVISWATRRVPHLEQDLHTVPEHLRSPLVFGGVRVVYSLVFYIMSCGLLFLCLFFSFLAIALSVYFRFMSLTVPLVSFDPLLSPRDSPVTPETKVLKRQIPKSCHLKRKRINKCLFNYRYFLEKLDNVLETYQ